MLGDPLAEDMINGFPMGKVGGQVAPRAAALDQIKDGVNDAPPVYGRASVFGGFGEHWFEVGPLGVSQISVVFGDFSSPQQRCRESGFANHPSKIKRFLLFSSENILASNRFSTFQTVSKNTGQHAPFAPSQITERSEVALEF
jgi:hypothetical protein